MNRLTYPNSLYPLTGDVQSNVGSNGVAVTGLQGIALTPDFPNDKDVLTYSADAHAWASQPVPTPPPPPIATTSAPGLVQPDGSTISVTSAGVISVVAGSGGGGVTGSNQTNGYVKFSNGLIMQWCIGTQSVNGRGSMLVALPQAFPNAILNVQATVVFDNDINSANWQGAAFYVMPNPSLSQVYLQYDVRSDGSADTTYRPYIFAIGY